MTDAYILAKLEEESVEVLSVAVGHGVWLGKLVGFEANPSDYLRVVIGFCHALDHFVKGHFYSTLIPPKLVVTAMAIIKQKLQLRKFNTYQKSRYCPATY